MDDRAAAARIDRLPITGVHRRLLWILAIPLFFDLSDIFTFSDIAPVLRDQWHLTLDDIALTTAMGFLGMAIGGCIGGVIADRIGRVKAMMLFTAIFSLFSLANGFATNLDFLLVTRFLTGIGISSATVSVVTYLAELFPAAVRGRWQSWAMVIGLSAIPVTSWVALLVVPLGAEGWRYVFVWGAFGLPFLLVARRLEESPRWLARCGRTQEAEASLSRFEARIRREGGHLLPPVQVTSPTLPSLGWSALFSEAYRRRTLALCGIWFFQTIGFYGFMSWVPTLLAEHGFAIVRSLTFVSLINVGAVPGALIAVYLSDRYERKYSIAAVAITIAIFGLAYGLTFRPALIVLFGFLVGMTVDMFAALCFAYTPEQFPTDVRNSGTGLAYGVGRLANVVNPFVISTILATIGYPAVFAYIAGAWVITALIALTWGVRTTGRSLERISTEDGGAELVLSQA